MADFINFRLSGVARAEISLASTTQLFNPRQLDWSRVLQEKLGLPSRFFPQICPGGTHLGPLRGPFAQFSSLAKTEVAATCSHDTAAAVAAIPAQGTGWAFLSSGTWSLLGVELTQPLITEESFQANFTNEIGFGNSVRFLKNLSGLWILQECRRAWIGQGEDLSYSDLMRLAASEPEGETALIDPGFAEFAEPGKMPEKIARFCLATRQTAPRSPGQFTRTILESLALLYESTLRLLEKLTDRSIDRVHIVGGGSLNTHLNQLTADVLQREVIAGPVEATALGNILVQAFTCGVLPGLPAVREVVRRSFPARKYHPQSGPWASRIDKFSQILAR